MLLAEAESAWLAVAGCYSARLLAGSSEQ